MCTETLKTIKNLAAACVTFMAASAAHAEAPDWQTTYEEGKLTRATYVPVDEEYALGIDRFDLDRHTEIIGWRLSDRWYFGRQDGLDSGLTFVWQQNDQQQVSVSKDGIRLTRRF